MNFSHYTDDAVAAAVDLVNDELDSVRDVEEFIRSHAVRPRRVTSADVRDLNVLRGRLREVFAAAADGDSARAARLLNRLIEEADVRPELTDHDGVWHLHYTPAGVALARGLTGMTAMALALVLVSYGPDRLKLCSADDCNDVFVDVSRNTSRRYCSDRCSNRSNVAAFRARKRAEG